MQPSEDRSPDGRSPRLLPPITEVEGLQSPAGGRRAAAPRRGDRGRSRCRSPPHQADGCPLPDDIVVATQSQAGSRANHTVGRLRRPNILGETVSPSLFLKLAREVSDTKRRRPSARKVCEYAPSANVSLQHCHLNANMWSRSSTCCFSGGGHSYKGRCKKKKIGLRDETEVSKYLDSHREFLVNYVVENVTLEDMESIFVKKMKNHYADDEAGPSKRLARLFKKKPIKTSFTSLVKKLKDCQSELTVVWELAKTITNAVSVDAFRVYKIYPDSSSFIQCLIADGKHLLNLKSGGQLEKTDPKQVLIALEAATKKCCIRTSKTEDPVRFPDNPTELLKSFKVKNVEEAKYIFYQPILLVNGKTGYVIEMWRVYDRFGPKDEEISANYVLWGSMALHFCIQFLDKKKEGSMSEFLLDVVKSIFEDMVSLDQLIKRILEFAQRLVNADRASMFLADYKNNELVSTVFDLKFEAGQEQDIEKKEIRMPMNRGIAGYVALSGETMNIPDAYADYRFNREVDEATGYKTVSILCMPIKVEGKVIGVVQMVNKRTKSVFHHDDEIAFEIFSSFFGLALHNARLYDRIRRKEQKYKVALEVLSYHNTCKENEVVELLSSRCDVACDLNNFKLDPYKLNDVQKCKSVIKMFGNLFQINKFDIRTLGRFVLTVKKNYRLVPYHNFDHGWSVAHAMYNILRCDHKGRFDYHRRLALFVASLCHDLDHRGYTNKYMSETASPLAAMYTTSTLEHHHFNSTVTILQQEGHNIFANISSDDYKKVLGYIRHAILATDLAVFFPNLDKMKKLQSPECKNKFDWNIPIHCDLAMAISMTAADLSASAKPWKVQIKTVKVIFEEFYAQGDKERSAGKTPIPMMDRYQPGEQPASQVGFMSQICLPCYSMLHSILPRTYEMYEMAQSNLDNWERRANDIKDPKNNDGLYTRMYDVTRLPVTNSFPDLPIRKIIDVGDEINIFEEINFDNVDQSIIQKYRQSLSVNENLTETASADTTAAQREYRSGFSNVDDEIKIFEEVNIESRDQSTVHRDRQFLAIDKTETDEVAKADSKNQSRDFRKEGECSRWLNERVVIETKAEISFVENISDNNEDEKESEKDDDDEVRY